MRYIIRQINRLFSIGEEPINHLSIFNVSIKDCKNIQKHLDVIEKHSEYLKYYGVEITLSASKENFLKS